MPSKKMEEFLKKASPDTLSQVREAGQTLQNNSAQQKPMNYAPQAPPRMGEPRPNAAEPKLNGNLAPSPKAENAIDRANISYQAKLNAKEQGQTLQKNDVQMDKER
jgi:hypothetical protein